MKKSPFRKLSLLTVSKFTIIALLTCIFLLPFVVMISTSFRTLEDAFTLPVTVIPREFSFTNYSEALAKIPFWKYMGNTAFITFFTVLGQLTVTPMVAYSLSKIKWKGAPIITALLMATMMIPYTVTMIPLYRFWNTIKLSSTYAPLILPAFCGNAFYIIIMRQFFLGIPNSLMEAARIDGTNEWQRYLFICMPLCKPALTTIGIYAFLAAWSDYLGPLIYIQKADRMTLSLGLQQFLNEFTVDWTLLMAAATVFVLPVIILFLIFQKNFVEGIATSGIKA